MARLSTFETKFRRRREGRTDYRKRLALLKGKKPRLVVRRSNKNFRVQVVEFERKGDSTVAGAFSRELEKHGWTAGFGNTSAAYLTGFLCAKKALKAGVKECVADIGLVSPVRECKAFAAVKGAIDAGLGIAAEEKVFPSTERISGKHVSEYAAKLSEGERKKKFSQYFSKGFDVLNIPKKFEEAKKSVEERFK